MGVVPKKFAQTILLRTTLSKILHPPLNGVGEVHVCTIHACTITGGVHDERGKRKERGRGGGERGRGEGEGEEKQHVAFI